MKKIKSISLSTLRVEEDFGFLKLILGETSNLPKDGTGEDGHSVFDSLNGEGSSRLAAAAAGFEAAVNAFDDTLKDPATTPSTALAAEADNARDNAWRGANNYLKAMTAHPDDKVRRDAAGTKALFDKYGDPSTLPQTEESGILHNLLQDLKAIDGGTLTAIAFGDWLANLEACETAFLSAVSQRTEEEAARQVGIVKESRLAADNAYRTLVELVNALAVLNGGERYATFIDRVNAIIDRQRTVLKARHTNARRKEGDDGTVTE